MILQKLFDSIKHSIKGRLITNVILIHAFLMGFIVYDIIKRQEKFMQQQMSDKGYELASILASNASHALLNNDIVALDELLFQMSDIKDTYMIFLLDHTAKVRASTDKSYFNQTLIDSQSKMLIRQSTQSANNSYQTTHNHLVDTIHSVRVKGHTIGYARIILDRRNLSRQIKIVTDEGIFYTFLAIIFGGIIAWLAIRNVTRRLQMITDAATRLGNKEFNVKLPEIEGKDEVAKVAKAFSVMSGSISAYIEEQNRTREQLKHSHDELEIKVRERTEDLIKANEKLQGLDKLKSMFIASMSHELRTPLNSIIGFTSLVLTRMDGEINAQQEDHLRRVKNAGQHLLGLISDVIDISKIEAGRVEPDKEVFLLDNLLLEAIEEIEVMAKEKKLILKMQIQQDIEIHTDKRRLYQCVLNYLSNAVKFSEQGTITLKSEAVDDKIIISVTDTGIGIASQDQSKLFEAFERIETHLRIRAGGSGLGLYLTKKIAQEILQGEVFFQSVENGGSTFGLIIPKEI